MTTPPGPQSDRPTRPATGLGLAAGADPLTFRSLVAGIGGVLGILEAVLPPLVFLVAYQVLALQAAPRAVSREALAGCVVAPLVLAVLFVIWRVVKRQRLGAAIGGALATALSAVLALSSGNANDNFVPGLFINAGYGLVFLVTVLVGYPIIGVAVALLLNDQRTWRSDPVKRRLFTWLTLLWVALFAVRLIVEVPLYLAGNQVVALGVARIALGLPLYAPVLVLTVLAVQAVYRRRPAPSVP
ncbi:MAG: hypothetical protein QOC59_1410 [Microbacteriaceae bacterium]|jgi:hypothetical protein|nr:hypothetical protein [Microbacteriaceae bacterium]